MKIIFTLETKNVKLHSELINISQPMAFKNDYSFKKKQGAAFLLMSLGRRQFTSTMIGENTTVIFPAKFGILLIVPSNQIRTEKSFFLLT